MFQQGIEGKRVLVAGASRGIGRAAALAFAEERCHVVAAARSGALLRDLVEEMKGLSPNTEMAYEEVDLLESVRPSDFAETLLKRYGTFDIVVHAIGGSLVGSRSATAPLEDWQKSWMFNCGIAIGMNEKLIPPMQRQRWGRVIHISSISAVMLRGSASYASSKAYLNAYTTTIGRALAQDGVVVSAVMPGAVAFEGSYWDKFVKEGHPRVNDFLSHHQAAGRFGTPEEIAPFILLLASDKASFAQGGLYPVDGGNM